MSEVLNRSGPASPRADATWWLLVGVVLLVFGTNLQGIIVPIRGHERGSGMTVIGLYSAIWSLGFLGSSVAFGFMLARFGHVRAFMGLTVVSSICALLYPVVPQDIPWIVIRLVSGFCYGGAAAIVEAWVLECAPAGAAFSYYMVANLFASLWGTFSLDLIRPDGSVPFLLAGGSLFLSCVPVLFGGTVVPPRPQPFRPRPYLFARDAPLAAVGCLMAGLVTGALGGLGPVFGMMSGLGMRDLTLMLAGNCVGGALAYAPVSFLAARCGRPLLLAALAGLGILVSIPVVLLGSRIGAPGLIVLLFLFGIAQYPIYGLSIGLACQRASNRPVPAVSSEGLLIFGSGTIAGPIIGSQVMRAGTANLFMMMGGLFVFLCLTAAVEIRREPERPRDASTGSAE